MSWAVVPSASSPSGSPSFIQPTNTSDADAKIVTRAFFICDLRGDLLRRLTRYHHAVDISFSRAAGERNHERGRASFLPDMPCRARFPPSEASSVRTDRSDVSYSAVTVNSS